ncbi:hypothetical protein B566_EDAN018219 [Ephemera danica]|nr:hypothetical protein B566_EDAN018219 [Ephemera danica]
MKEHEDHENDSNTGREFPTTYLVLRFVPGAQIRALRWLVDRIKARHDLGGAELLLRRQPGTSPSEGLILHVSATPSRLRQAAEELDLRRPHQQEPLSSSERRFIVQYELRQGIRANPVEVMSQHGILEDMYPLHNKEQLRRLRRLWYCTLFRAQPIEEIRGYFGEAVALYFCFLGFYLTALLGPAFFGLVQLALADDDSSLPAVCSILTTFWVILFLVMWKRRSNELAYRWGTIKMTGLDAPRASFRGQMGIDRVTDNMQPQYPRWKSFLKMYTVSWPIALVCVSVAFYVMLASFWAEQHIIVWGNANEIPEKTTLMLSLIPGVLYCALVWLMNRYYRRLATWLTEWENHRTQSQFDRHRTLKLVVFEFVNNFMALFYIAFVYQDMEMLRYQIKLMLILLQAFNHFQEAFIPFWLLKYARRISRAMRKEKLEQRRTEDDEEAAEDAELQKAGVRRRLLRRLSSLSALMVQNIDQTEKDQRLGLSELSQDDPRVLRAFEESQQEVYESTYDDYLEMFIQFGYVVLFSPVFPAAALCAVFNNVLEMRTDAFKLCRVTQRPLPERVKDIGAWQRAFEAIGVISVATNCALLYITPGLKSRVWPNASDLQWALSLGGLEHTLLALGLILYLAVPSQPEWVRVELARQHYKSQRVLRKTKIA